MAAEHPDVVYGRLLEAAHFGGYAAERVASEFKWLLTKSRWREVGRGFKDIDAFLADINLSQYRISVEDRKEIVRLLDRERATQRAAAKALGVTHTTIQRALGTNVPKDGKGNVMSQPDSRIFGTNVPKTESATFQAVPADVAKLVEKENRKREQEAGREDQRQALRGAEAKREDQAAEERSIDVLLADPPWAYEFAETSSRDIENQYPTATIEEIEGHVLKKWFPVIAQHAVLFLWATAPKLPEALRVMEVWGFTYKTNAAWDKEKFGMGYWFRGQHELLLVGTKGNMQPPDRELRVSSVFREMRRNHSVKPESVYSAIEAMFPGLELGEIYQRHERPRWKGFGLMDYVEVE
jgi:N6-adenosine-specific RNA methylase IME4